MKDEKEILGLTGLRFVAAFYVFLFHIHIRWPLVGPGFLSNVLNQGAVGMSIFFLLSGFVLAYRYQDGRTGLRDYLVNRFARIYPVYVIAALVTLPWFGISFGDGSIGDVARGAAQGALLLFANIFLIQAWFPQFFSLWNVGGSWSISVEAFCYLLLPVILPALSRLTWRQQKGVAIACLILASLPGISAKLFETPSAGVFYFMPIFRLPEFVLGCIVCIAWAGRRVRAPGTSLQLCIVVAFVAYLGFAGPALPVYVGHNWVALPFIAGATLCLAFGRGAFAAVLSTPLFVWLGKISYSFYSFQALLILFLIARHDQLVSAYPWLANNWALCGVAFLALTAMSAAGRLC